MYERKDKVEPCKPMQCAFESMKVPTDISWYDIALHFVLSFFTALHYIYINLTQVKGIKNRRITGWMDVYVRPGLTNKQPLVPVSK